MPMDYETETPGGEGEAGVSPKGSDRREAGDLNTIIRGIADQLADADRRHSVALKELQGRLTSLADMAQGMREHVPHEMTHELDRIEQNMAALSQKISEADEAAKSEGAASRRAMLAATPDWGDMDSETGSEGEAPAPIKSVLTADALGSLTRRDEGQKGAGKPDIDPFDVVDFEEPWDEESAEKLTEIYESSDSEFSKLAEFGAADGAEADASMPDDTQSAEQSQPALVAKAETPDATALLTNERNWLESRFADIAARLDKSLQGMQQGGSVSELDSRFAKLEESLSLAMAGAVTREDLSGLKTIEAQFEDLSAQMATVQTHFSRLDSIEFELRALADQVSEERLAKLFEDMAPKASNSAEVAEVVASRVSEQMPQIEAALRTIAERMSEEKINAEFADIGGSGPNPSEMARLVAEQLAPQLSMSGGREDGGAERLEELRALVHDFVNERRHGDEQTNTMLDTMQQAMIRLLDRMDAIEAAQATPIESDEESFEAYRAHPEAGDLEQLEREPVSYRRQVNGPDIPVDLPPGQDRRRVQDEASGPQARLATDDMQLAGSAVPMRTQLRSSGAGSQTTGVQATPSDAIAKGGAASSREDFIAAARRAARQAAETHSEDSEETTEVQVPLEPEAGTGAVKPKRGKAKASRGPSRLTIALLCLLAVGTGFAVFKTQLIGGFSTSVQSPASVKKPAPAGGGTATDPKKGSGAKSDPKSLLKDADEEIKGKSTGAPLQAPQFGDSRAIIAPASTGGLPGDLPAIDGATALANASNGGGLGPVSAIYGNVSEAAAVPAVPAALTAANSTLNSADAAQGPLALPPAAIGPYSLRHAAANGVASAQFEIAARFAEGKGVQQDLKEAVVWYQRSASKGFAPAQYRLASMYERGFGVTADAARAKLWYERAAVQGVVKAMHNLAVLSSGRGGATPNYEVAIRWFTQAAGYGLLDSQFNLAIMHDSGLGVARDPGQAYKWFAIAARGGDAEASRRRDNIRAKLSPEQLKALDAEVSNWRPRSAQTQINDMRLAGEVWKQAN